MQDTLLKVQEQQPPSETPMQHCEGVGGQQNQSEGEGAKIKRWTEREQILYILFLESNREKTKSKLFRRSNQFYKEMAAFLTTKTRVQCRSHHQKFQAKHKFPHKIIKQEKDRIDLALYDTIKHSLSQIPKKSENIIPSSRKPTKTVKPQMKQASCQTYLQGVCNTIKMEDPQRSQQYSLTWAAQTHQSSLPYFCSPWAMVRPMTMTWPSSFL